MKDLFYYSLSVAIFFLVYEILHSVKKEKIPRKPATEETVAPIPWMPLLVLFLFKLILIICLLAAGFTELWADDPSRWMMSFEWGRDPWFAPQDHVWLGMSFYIFGGAMKILPDPLLASLIVSILASLSSLFAMYFYATRISSDNTIGFLSALLFASIPMHTWLSVMTMSDLLYMVFLGLALGLFLNYLRRFREGETGKARGSLVFFALCVFCMTGTRYEGWVMTLCLGLAFWMHWLLCRPHQKGIGWAWLIGVSLVMILYPLLWSLSSWRFLGSPTAFWENQARLNAQYATLFVADGTMDRLLRYPKTLYRNFGGILPLAAAGIAFIFVRARKMSIPAVGAGIGLLYMLLLELFAIKGGTSMGLSRCIQPFIFLFLPFALLPLHSFRKSGDHSPGRLRNTFLLLLGIAPAVFFMRNISSTFQWHNPWQRADITNEGVAMARYLQAEMRNPEDLSFLPRDARIVIWTDRAYSPEHLVFRKLSSNPKRLVFAKEKQIPSYWLENPQVLIIAHKRELADPRWREIKRFGAYILYRHEKTLILP
jgi:hypothetical protein